MRLMDRLEDDERLEALLKKLSRRAPSLPSSAAHTAADSTSQRIRAGACSETSSLASDVRKAKAGVDRLADRMQHLKQRSWKEVDVQ